MNEVGIAELKAKLSENLGRVRRGETITVLDRKTPVAMIIPFRFDSEPLRVRRAAGKRKLGRIPLPPPVAVKKQKGPELRCSVNASNSYATPPLVG